MLSNCSIPLHPVEGLQAAVTGLVDGDIITCGGVKFKATLKVYILFSTLCQVKTVLETYNQTATDLMEQLGFHSQT